GGNAVDGGRTGYRGGRRRVEHHQRRAAAGLIDGAAQDTAGGGGCPFGLGPGVAGGVLGRAPRLPSPPGRPRAVAAPAGGGLVLLLVRVETVVVALVLARDVVRQLVELEPLAAHLGLVHRRAKAGEDRVPVVTGVIDRHVPLGDRHLATHGDDEGVREHQVG